MPGSTWHLYFNRNLYITKKYIMKYSGSIFKRSLILCIGVIAIAGIFWSCSEDDDVVPVPTVSAITPAEAMVGDEVIIAGTNFSHTPYVNVVHFNGVLATVTESGVQHDDWIVSNPAGDRPSSCFTNNARSRC